MKYRDQTTTAHLKDIALTVSTQKFKAAFAEMLCIELKLVNDCHHKSSKKNIKVFRQKIPDFEKQIYGEENPIDWSANCKICDFYLDMSTHVTQTQDSLLVLLQLPYNTVGDFNVETDKMFPLSYVLVFTFQQDLH